MSTESPMRALLATDPERDFIVVSRSIGRDLHADLTRLLDERTVRKDHCTLVLTTYGGDPHAGYRIARCLRHHYKSIRLVIPSYCKSAGTLIAIAADELAIGDRGELGPLDIQVANPAELQERSSGLDPHQALEITMQHAIEAFRAALVDIRLVTRLSTKLAGEFASKLAAGMVEPLYAQIDPNRLGELQRAMRITHEYGSRLNGYSSNLKNRTLDKLVAGYPSHSFVIDRKEARDLFHRVFPTNAAEDTFCKAHWNLVGTESESGPFDLRSLDASATQGDDDADTSATQPDACSSSEAARANNGQRVRRSAKAAGAAGL